MYTDYYGLSAQPFQLTPDARFYFESGTHKKAMAYLGYGLAQGEGFIVVTGEIGSGKTTLVRHLLDAIDPARVKAAHIVSTQVESEELLRLVASSFGLATGGDKASLIAAIEGYARERAQAGQRVLVIVDEAQNLPHQSLEELRMLSNVQLGDQAVIQIFLLGQPEFRARLAGDAGLEQLRQRVIATHHLTAMDADEVGPYITHRLVQAGWSGRPQLTGDAFDAVHGATGGMPRRINQLMTRVLLMASVEQREAIDGALIETVLSDLDRDETAGISAIASSDPAALDLGARVAMLEAQVEEQGAALRRVVGLLVDWVEADAQQPAQADRRQKPAA